jgi:hypothetical protein
MIRKAFKEEIISLPRLLNGVPGSGQTENGETGEKRSQEHAHHFL